MGMSPEFKLRLKKLMILHEDYRKRPYLDTKNIITVGIGHNMQNADMPESLLMQYFEEDSDAIYEKLWEYEWFRGMNEARQLALVDFCFAGMKTFEGFTEMIHWLGARCYNSAAKELLDSKYADEVGQRADDLAKILVTGDVDWLIGEDV